MHMVWEKGLLKLMQRLKEGPEAIDKSSNKYIVRFFGFLLLLIWNTIHFIREFFGKSYFLVISLCFMVMIFWGKYLCFLNRYQ